MKIVVFGICLASFVLCNCVIAPPFRTITYRGAAHKKRSTDKSRDAKNGHGHRKDKREYEDDADQSQDDEDDYDHNKDEDERENEDDEDQSQYDEDDESYAEEIEEARPKADPKKSLEGFYVSLGVGCDMSKSKVTTESQEATPTTKPTATATLEDEKNKDKDKKAEGEDKKAGDKDKKAGDEDKKAGGEDKKAGDEDKKAEDGDMKAEDGDMKAEDGDMKAEDGDMKAEDGDMKAENEDIKAEDKDTKAEDENDKNKDKSYENFKDDEDEEIKKEERKDDEEKKLMDKYKNFFKNPNENEGWRLKNNYFSIRNDEATFKLSASKKAKIADFSQSLPIMSIAVGYGKFLSNESYDNFYLGGELFVDLGKTSKKEKCFQNWEQEFIRFGEESPSFGMSYPERNSEENYHNCGLSDTLKKSGTSYGFSLRGGYYIKSVAAMIYLKLGMANVKAEVESKTSYAEGARYFNSTKISKFVPEFMIGLEKIVWRTVSVKAEFGYRLNADMHGQLDSQCYLPDPDQERLRYSCKSKIKLETGGRVARVSASWHVP